MHRYSAYPKRFRSSIGPCVWWAPTTRDSSDLQRLVRYARTATRENLTSMRNFSGVSKFTDSKVQRRFQIEWKHPNQCGIRIRQFCRVLYDSSIADAIITIAFFIPRRLCRILSVGLFFTLLAAIEGCATAYVTRRHLRFTRKATERTSQ